MVRGSAWSGAPARRPSHGATSHRSRRRLRASSRRARGGPVETAGGTYSRGSTAWTAPRRTSTAGVAPYAWPCGCRPRADPMPAPTPFAGHGRGPCARWRRSSRSWARLIRSGSRCVAAPATRTAATSPACRRCPAARSVAGAARSGTGTRSRVLARRARRDAGVLVARLPAGPVFLAAAHRALAQARPHRPPAVAVASLVVGFLGFPWLGYVIGREPTPTGRGHRARRVAGRAAQRHRARAQPAATGPARSARIARRGAAAPDHRRAPAHRPRAPRRGRAQHVAHQHPGRRRAAPHGRAIPSRHATRSTTIKGASKEALVELRSILGVLRQVDEDAPRAPTPSLDRLDDLVERSRGRRDRRAPSTSTATSTACPRNIDLAAFRIIQESLTNVARHADGPRRRSCGSGRRRRRS